MEGYALRWAEIFEPKGKEQMGEMSYGSKGIVENQSSYPTSVINYVYNSDSVLFLIQGFDLSVKKGEWTTWFLSLSIKTVP